MPFLTISIDFFDRLQAPVVQRVSKTVFVVKCTTASNKYPLGYLHCSLIETRNGKTGVLERKFVCPCRKLNHQNSKSSHDVNQQSKECVHFYACILAFISDEKYMNEFSYHIQVRPFSFFFSLQFQRIQFEILANLGVECVGRVVGQH